MSRETRPVLAFVPTALHASQVGAWQSDLTTDRTVGDATTAFLFGVDPDEAAHGLPLTSYTQNIHPDDQSEFRRKLASVRDRGGLFVIEYRTCPSPTDVRWVLARGRYEREPPTNQMVGRGIVIDITESKLDGRVEDRAFFVRPEGAVPTLEHVASLVLEARGEIDELGEHESSPLRRAVDALLWIIGRTLALRQTEPVERKRQMN
jgi:hypothetical protein